MRDEKLKALRFVLRPSSFIFRFALIAAVLAIAVSSFALDCPPKPPQWYNDPAGLLDAASADTLNRKLADFEQQSGAQFIIYALPSLEGDAIERFTVDCAQKWGVGQNKYDNGLIVFVFVKERKLRVEVGYGLEGTITDAFSSDVIRDYIAPHFKQDDYAGGLNAGADAIIAKIRGGEAPVPPTSPGATGQPARSAGRGAGGGMPCSPLFFLIAIIVFLVIVPALLMPNRRHGCGGCMLPFFLWPSGGSTFSGGGGFGGGGGFSGGGGSFGGGGASGGW